MATKLEKTIKRETEINGKPAVVSFGPEGVTIQAPRSSKKFTMPFAHLIEVMAGIAESAGEKDDAKYIAKTFGA